MEDSERVSSQTPAVADQLALVIAYELFSEASTKYFGGTLAGKLIAGCGMGKFGGTQALAAPMNGAAFLGIDANPEEIKQRVKSGHCDVMVNDLDEALRILKNAARKCEATSVGLTGNCADIIEVIAKRGVVPDLLIDQATEHDSSAALIDGLHKLEELGSKIFAWSDSLTELIAPKQAKGFAPIYVAAPSGQPADIRRIDSLVLELFSQDESLARWTRLVQKRTRFQDPPARAYWLNREQQTTLREAITDLAAKGQLKSGVIVDEYRFNSTP
jgi:urocanate hydratase